MFSTFFAFEVKNWLRAPMPWIFLFLFGLLTFSATVSDQVQIGGSYGNVWKNAPYVAQNWYAVFSILALLLVTAFFNNAALRDIENNTAQIVFSSPINKAGYYFGHFAGALLISLIPMLGISLGMWAGVVANGLFDWLDPERFGPFEIMGHLNAYLVIVIPNMIFVGGILYTVAILTRSTLFSFIAGIVLLVGYIIAGNLIQNIENEQLGSLLDPFGGRAFDIVTKYWTVDDKNHQSVNLMHPGILVNRVLWMGVGLLVLVLGYFRFGFSEKRSGSKKAKTGATEDAYGVQALGERLRVAPSHGWGVTFAQLRSQFRTDFWGVVKSVPFILLSFIGLLNTIPNFIYATESYGTHNFPITYDMVNNIRGSFYIFVIAIMAYFTGALVWKERNAKVNEIYDALPTRNWTGYVAKLAAIISIIAILLSIAISAAMAAQAAHGFLRFEFGVYLRELLVIDLLGFVYLCALFMLIHVLSPNMYLGFFLCVVVLIVNSFAWGVLHIDSNMVEFAAMPSYTLSDFWGYKPYAAALSWFNAYWLLFSLILAVATIIFWPRGKDSAWTSRFKMARLEWKQYRLIGLGAVVTWALTAGFVFYNTKILNTYKSGKEMEKLSVRYENEYKKYQGVPQPRIYKVKFDVQVFPEQRIVDAHGDYWVRNINPKPIDSLWVSIPRTVKFTFDNQRLNLLMNDSALYTRLYRIEPALQPGDSMLLKFASVYRPKGFENELTVTQVMQNGTFFNNTDISPNFGYQESVELTDKNDRKKYGLPEKSRMPALNQQDTVSRMDSYLTSDADWVTVETTISTTANQRAIAPGSLVREWTEGGRNHYHYKLDHKGWNFFSFMSADYQVARRRWRDIDLEVYYHSEHAWNVERMLKSMEKSLEYYTTNFGPYYHKQCRIIEFPRVSDFAQAFPGTMPYSEGIGFIENFQAEEDDIDMVFYVVAHEMGHQWWAHQEAGARMQGAEMTTETFAQYSALMVMEKEYGRDQMRKFMKYEMDRYLRGRGRERLKEMPLAKCENQGYIHYNKGSVQMYALKELIGEERVNAGLRTFLENFRYKEAPYPTSADALGSIYAQTPDSLKYLINDLFWDITLFENRTKEARVKELSNGKFEVSIDVACRKLKADDLGKETEVPVNDWIEIGAFAKAEGDKKYGKTLYRERVKIDKSDQTFTFVVDEKPEKAGVDPFSLLVDREPEDNMKEVK